MTAHSYLVRNRHGTFYFRATIPKQLRQHFPNHKREIKRSLKTDSRKLAIVRARAYRAEFDKMIEQLEEDERRKKLEELKEQNPHAFSVKLEGTRKIAMPDGTEHTIAATSERNILSPVAGAENYPHTKQLPPELVKQASTESLPYKAHMLGQLREEELQFHKIAASYQTRPETTQPTPVIASDSILLSEAIYRYIEDKKALGCWKPRSAHQVETTLRDFKLIVSDQPLTAITKPTIAAYRQKYAKLPANRNKLIQYKGKSIDEILAMPDVKPIDGTTLRNNLGRVSPFFAWCVDNELIKTNPAEGITKPLPKKKNAKQARDTFNSIALKALFESDEYKKFKEPYRYWVPLIGLYSGARLEEICKLELADIKQDEGVWFFNIEDAKSPAGWRTIPIHRTLIDLGFLRYVENLKHCGHSRLFPELTKGRDGYSDRVSKWFARYRKRCGITSTKYRECFHSLRHTFKDRIQRKHRIDKSRIQALLGHEPDDVTDGTYGNFFTAADLKQDVDLLDYGLNHPRNYLR